MKPPCARPVEIWPMDRPKPHPDNPRTHSGEQVAQIAKSIETFEALRPIVVDEQDYILAGHGIWLAHRQLQRQEIAVAVVDHLTEPQKRAFLIADNQIALNSAWDEQKLGSLIALGAATGGRERAGLRAPGTGSPVGRLGCRARLCGRR